MGGRYWLDYIDDIYYGMSKDLCIDNIDNIWQKSQISLPDKGITNSKCMITHQTTFNPKLIILGGYDRAFQKGTTIFFEYQLSDIIGFDTFYRFMLDFNTVTCICLYI